MTDDQRRRLTRYALPLGLVLLACGGFLGWNAQNAFINAGQPGGTFNRHFANINLAQTLAAFVLVLVGGAILVRVVWLFTGPNRNLPQKRPTRRVQANRQDDARVEPDPDRTVVSFRDYAAS